MMYQVEYWEEDEDGTPPHPEWRKSGITFCTGTILCQDCLADHDHMGNCDYVHEVPEKRVAEECLRSLQEDGLRARILEVRQ